MLLSLLKLNMNAEINYSSFPCPQTLVADDYVTEPVKSLKSISA